ncbi:MAG: acyl-CoA synthetase [Acidimicrobiales bacterium]
MTRPPTHLPVGIEPPDLLHEGSLPGAWGRRWRSAPDALVVWSEGRWYTAAEVDNLSRRAAAVLADAGLSVGDRLLVSAGPSIELIAFHAGALRSGLVVVPANTAYGRLELEHLVGDAEPGAGVFDDPARAALVGNVPAIVIGPQGPGDTDASHRILSDHGPGLEASALDRSTPGDPAMLGYTSGTTGRPKGAILSHGNLLSSAAALQLAWRWDRSDRLILALPLFHMHGLGVGVHGTLLAGASMVLLPRFDVDAVIDAVDEHQATMFFGVPTMYARLAASPRLSELGSLRLCVSGSAPLPPELFARIRSASGQDVLERYGMTETVMNLSNPYDGERRPGSVGFPLPGVEMRLLDGEILLRGPNVCSGYWRDEAATAAAFTDGWFRTGDVAEVDTDGYVRIVGRNKELIISGGFNVYPREVEEALLDHPAVREAAVAGTPDPEWGEIVTAFVVLDHSATADELIAHTTDRLAPYKRPRRVHMVKSLPRNAMGKIQRNSLVADTISPT